MNKIDYEDAGLQFVDGDRFSGGTGVLCTVDYFAWRTNTGVKPEFVEGGNVIEWVSLGVDEVIVSIKGYFNWNDSVVKWRPHLPSIKTETPEEKAALDKIAHVSGQSRCKQVDIKPTIIKSIQVNSEYTIRAPEKSSRINDFDGLKVRVTSIHKDNGDALITFRHPVHGVGVGAYKEGVSNWIKPIQAEREKALEDARKMTAGKLCSMVFNGSMTPGVHDKVLKEKCDQLDAYLKEV